jgi:hypothetical protein
MTGLAGARLDVPGMGAGAWEMKAADGMTDAPMELLQSWFGGIGNIFNLSSTSDNTGTHPKGNGGRKTVASTQLPSQDSAATETVKEQAQQLAADESDLDVSADVPISKAKLKLTDSEKKAVIRAINEQPYNILDHQVAYSGLDIGGARAPNVGFGTDFVVWNAGDEAFRVNKRLMPGESPSGNSLAALDRAQKFYHAAGLLEYKGMQKVGRGRAAFVMEYIPGLTRFDKETGKLTPEQANKVDLVRRYTTEATGAADTDFNFGFKDANTWGITEGEPRFFDPRPLSKKEYKRAMKFIKEHPLSEYK